MAQNKQQNAPVINLIDINKVMFNMLRDFYNRREDVKTDSIALAETHDLKPYLVKDLSAVDYHKILLILLTPVKENTMFKLYFTNETYYLIPKN